MTYIYSSTQLSTFNQITAELSLGFSATNRGQYVSDKKMAYLLDEPLSSGMIIIYTILVHTYTHVYIILKFSKCHSNHSTIRCLSTTVLIFTISTNSKIYY